MVDICSINTTEVLMSPNKTLYIRDDDVPTWEAAEKSARQTAQPLSQLIVRLLRGHVGRQVADDEITVEMTDRNGREWTEVFRGRWLIEPDADETRYGPDAGTYYGIAETAKDQIAVYSRHVYDMWTPRLNIYADLDEAEEVEQIAKEAIAIAAAAMGMRRVIHRDI
jgi:hypothetical protein